MYIKKVENGWYYDPRVHGKRYRGTERTKRKAEDKVIELQQMRYSPRERKTNTVLITKCLDLFEKRISELVKVNARSPKYLSRIQLSGKHFRKYFKEQDIVYVKQINYLLIDNYIAFTGKPNKRLQMNLEHYMRRCAGLYRVNSFFQIRFPDINLNP